MADISSIKLPNGVTYEIKDAVARRSSSSGGALLFTNKTVAASAWSSNSDLDYYSYRASVPLTGVTASMMPTVTFTDSQLAEYDLAPICQSYAGGVYIYSAEAVPEAMTIPSIGVVGEMSGVEALLAGI